MFSSISFFNFPEQLFRFPSHFCYYPPSSISNIFSCLKFGSVFHTTFKFYFLLDEVHHSEIYKSSAFSVFWRSNCRTSLMEYSERAVTTKIESCLCRASTMKHYYFSDAIRSSGIDRPRSIAQSYKWVYSINLQSFAGILLPIVSGRASWYPDHRRTETGYGSWFFHPSIHRQLYMSHEKFG